MNTIYQVAGTSYLLGNDQYYPIVVSSSGNPITGASGVTTVKITNTSTGNVATPTWTLTSTTYTFTNVSAADGTGNSASFNVLITWDSFALLSGLYTVTLDNAGEGYSIDDTLFVAGTQLGGISPDNDFYIGVQEVSETGSIVAWNYGGGTAAWPQSIDGSTTVTPGATEFIQVSSGSQPIGVWFTNSVDDDSAISVAPVNVIFI
jgi:hypothetical protein